VLATQLMMKESLMPSGGQRPAFGRIDPVVWVPVAAILIVAMLFLFGGFPPVGIGMLVLAALLVLVDARINRPSAASARRPQGRGPQGRRSRDIR
jgi:hypothetical protein